MASWGRCGGRLNSCRVVRLLAGGGGRTGRSGRSGRYFEEVGVAGRVEVDVGVGGVFGLEDEGR